MSVELKGQRLTMAVNYFIAVWQRYNMKNTERQTKCIYWVLITNESLIMFTKSSGENQRINMHTPESYKTNPYTFLKMKGY